MPTCSHLLVLFSSLVGEVPSNPFASPGPAGAAASDPFGMGTFNPTNGAPFQQGNAANGAAFGGSSQQELMDIQVSLGLRSLLLVLDYSYMFKVQSDCIVRRLMTSDEMAPQFTIWATPLPSTCPPPLPESKPHCLLYVCVYVCVGGSSLQNG